MDARQEARDQFDRVMRVPDKIVMAACLFGLALPALFLLGELLDGRRPTHSEMMFYISAKIAVLAVYALYFATRFMTALVIATIAVRRRDRISARGAGLQAGRLDARAQTAHQLAAGR